MSGPDELARARKYMWLDGRWVMVVYVKRIAYRRHIVRRLDTDQQLVADENDFRWVFTHSAERALLNG